MNRGEGARRDNIALGVTAVVVSVLALSLGDAVIKLYSVSFPLWQIYVVRSLLALPLLFIAIRLRRGKPSLIPVSVPWTAARCLLLALMWVAYYAALPHVQLSLAAAAYYTSPLFITLLAALFTGDKVGSKRWFAVTLGFIGVLVMLRPDADDFSLYSLLPVLAAVLYGLAMILTRTKCQREDPMALALALNVTFIIVGAIVTAGIVLSGLTQSLGSVNPFLFGPWAALGGDEWMALGSLAIAIVVGSIGAAVAYQSAPPSIVATFDYAYLAFATLWGLLVFAEIPDALSVVGMVMITSAGLLAVRR